MIVYVAFEDHTGYYGPDRSIKRVFLNEDDAMAWAAEPSGHPSLIRDYIDIDAS